MIRRSIFYSFNQKQKSNTLDQWDSHHILLQLLMQESFMLSRRQCGSCYQFLSQHDTSPASIVSSAENTHQKGCAGCTEERERKRDPIRTDFDRSTHIVITSSALFHHPFAELQFPQAITASRTSSWSFFRKCDQQHDSFQFACYRQL